MKYIILFLISFPVNAGIYMDLSLETHNETEDSFVQKSGEPIINLLGTIEIGYTIKNTSVFVRHTSSVQQVDIGLNVIGIKFRVI